MRCRAQEHLHGFLASRSSDAPTPNGRATRAKQLKSTARFTTDITRKFCYGSLQSRPLGMSRSWHQVTTLLAATRRYMRRIDGTTHWHVAIIEPIIRNRTVLSVLAARSGSARLRPAAVTFLTSSFTRREGVTTAGPDVRPGVPRSKYTADVYTATDMHSQILRDGPQMRRTQSLYIGRARRPSLEASVIHFFACALRLCPRIAWPHIRPAVSGGLAGRYARHLTYT